MTLQHFDTVIAFGAVMLAASLVVTAGTQLAISLLGLRGANLRRSLTDLFETASQDRDAKRYAKEIARRVLRHPLISGSAFSHFRIRLEELPFVPADAAGKLRWAGNGIPLQPWLLGALGGCFLWPITLGILRRLFSVDFCSYSDLVTRYVPVLQLCEHPWRSGAIVGAVLVGLVSRWRLATSIRLDELVAVLEKLSAPPDGTLPDPAQRAMLVIAGETLNPPRPKMNAASAPMERIFHDSTDETDEYDGGVAVAVEKAVKQVSAHAEPRVEGLNLWFEHAMDRASQRFTLQARVITVILSLALVFGAHLDAIRLYQRLSSDGQVRAQLAGSAEAIVKMAEQFPRAREGAGLQASREGATTVVPEVYRNAMVFVLMTAPATPEQTKPKSRRSSHSVAAPTAGSSEPLASGDSAAPNGSQISASVLLADAGNGQAPPPAAQAMPGIATTERANRAATQAKAKSSIKEREKSGAAPAEDKATVEAKARAATALEARPGFASREDAIIWLRATLEGDPALENLAAAYEQEINTQLVRDADKLIDHSASIKSNLARSEFRMFPENWPGWKPTGHELPGMLFAVVFLCLGAPFCFNKLKLVASLRPLRVTMRDK